jgi:hypothetical protein
VEIIKKEIAEGILCRFPQLRQFPQRVLPVRVWARMGQIISKTAMPCIGREGDRRL